MYLLKKINKIALSNNHDERWQVFDRIESYPYFVNVGKVCKKELTKCNSLQNLNIKMINFDDVRNEYVYIYNIYI